MADIAAQVPVPRASFLERHRRALLGLLAPVRRVAGYDCVMPLPRLEQHYMPSVERVLAAARDVMKYR